MQSQQKMPRLKITALVAGSIFLTSCAVPITRDERIGPDDGSDACRPYVVALDSTGNFFAEDMIKGAATGAVTGAVAGGMLALVSGHNVAQGALVGAVVGGVAGAVGGYYKSRMDQGRDQAVLAMGNDLGRESEALDKTDIAIKKLITCRVSQRDKIRSDYISHRISRSEAQSRWGRLQEQVQRDNKTMQMVAENIGKRQQEYKYANEQLSGNETQVVDDAYEQEDNVRTTSGHKRPRPKKPVAKAPSSKKQQSVAHSGKGSKKGGGKQTQLASKFSATQNKAEHTMNSAKNYQTTVAVSDNGFEKADTLLWENPRDALYSAVMRKENDAVHSLLMAVRSAA